MSQMQQTDKWGFTQSLPAMFSTIDHRKVISNFSHTGRPGKIQTPVTYESDSTCDIPNHLAGLSDELKIQSNDKRPVRDRPLGDRPDEKVLGDENNFSSRLRTLDIAILNNTKTTLRFVDAYFYSGTWYVSPKPVDIPPGQISMAYACSRKPSLCGVSGGIKYELLNTNKFLYIGFENPVLGQYKTFIALDSRYKSAEWACNQAKTDSVKSHYDGKYRIMAVIRPPILSRYRLFRYTIEDCLHVSGRQVIRED